MTAGDADVKSEPGASRVAVFDASAVLAWLRREPGAEFVDRRTELTPIGRPADWPPWA